MFGRFYFSVADKNVALGQRDQSYRYIFGSEFSWGGWANEWTQEMLDISAKKKEV